MPYEDSKTQQEEEILLLFPGKDSANEKPRTLSTKALSTSFSSV